MERLIVDLQRLPVNTLVGTGECEATLEKDFVTVFNYRY